jgi:hypothetical protein
MIKMDKTKLLLLKSLEKNLGIVTPTCKEVGVSRETFYRYYREDDEFKKSVDSINEITIDFAESQLLKKIKEGSERSILFFMKYKGKKRGYSDTINVNATLNGAIDISKLVGFEDDDDE